MSNLRSTTVGTKALSVYKKIYDIKDTIFTFRVRIPLISRDDESASSRGAKKESDSSKKPKEQFPVGSLADSIDTFPGIVIDDSDDEEGIFPITVAKDAVFFQDTMDEKQMSKTMSIALTTAVHLREAPNDNTKKQVADYAQKVFQSDDETFKELWWKAATQEKPADKLIIYIKKGSGLIALDANGKSDPYVRVGIIDATKQGQAIVKSKNMLDWKKEGKIMPTGEIQQSTIKEATLEPHWNEKVQLSIGNAEKEMLVVEVWDSDTHMAAPTKVKGLKHFLRDLRKADDFMGRAFIPLWSLSGRVEGKVLELCPHSGKGKHGTITVDLTVESVKKNVSRQVAMWEHFQLTHAVVDYEGKIEGQYQRKWNAQLSDEATQLLEKHAEFNGLSKAHMAAIRLSVLVKYHCMFGIRMSTFSALFEKIFTLEPEINTLHSRPTALESEALKWVNVLLTDLTELARNVEEALKNSLAMYTFKEPNHVERIRIRVTTLMELYSFPPFVGHLPPEKRNLPQLLEECIQKAVPVWFNTLRASLMPDQKNPPDMQLSGFKDLIQYVLNHSHRSLSKLNPVFEQAGVDYFTQFYVATDMLVCGEVIAKVKIQQSSDDVTTYEVYKALKEFRKLKTSVKKKYWKNLKVNTVHELFDTKVNDWVTLATGKCMAHIKNAVQLDKVVQVTDEVRFSSSALDCTGLLVQLMKLNNELEWPAKEEALTIKVSVVRNVCDLAIFYVEELHSSLKSEDMFDKQGRFRATEKLCIVLNNMQHIKQVIVTGKFLTDDPAQEHKVTKGEPGGGLTMEEREQARKEMEEERTVQDYSMALMKNVMQSAGEDIDTKIAGIIRRIIRQMSAEMNRLVKEVLSSKSPTIGIEIIDPLMTYLASNLQTLGNHLLTPVFQLILHDVWCVSTDCLLTFLGSGANKKAGEPSQYYSHLKFVLQSLKDFFHADGNGLTQDDLETKQYKELSYQLDILSLPTDRLILRFYSELADIQTAKAQTTESDPDNAKLGKLLLSIGYHQDKEVIEVNLFQGTDLPGLNRSGFSDPFVELEMMPLWHFGHSQPKKYKTSVKKKTVNPVYKEDYIIPASKQAIQVKGAILLITIYNHNPIGNNDLCGICVVLCKDIPHLTTVQSAFDDPNATQRKNLKLPLFKVPETSIALKEITSRGNLSDPKALEFFKNNKHILGPKSLLPGFSKSGKQVAKN